ncbi:MAG: YraN family protein [bacterium]
MPKKDPKSLGERGEQLAAEYLQKKRYRIRERNFRWARGEIDIVAQKDELLVFVEVKTARSDAFGEPETWVDERKQRQIARVAERYLQEQAISDMDCRFDVVAVKAQGNQWTIRHIENAFWL